MLSTIYTAIEVPTEACMVTGTARSEIWWSRPLLGFTSCCGCLHGISIILFGSADNIHLQQGVVAFNFQVSLPNAIPVNSALTSRLLALPRRFCQE